jgi:hypothetical protein
METIAERVAGLDAHKDWPEVTPCGMEATGKMPPGSVSHRARPGAPQLRAPRPIRARSLTRYRKALVAGERDPEALAELAKGTLRRKIPALREALAGRVRDRAPLVGEILARRDCLDEAIERLSAEIERVIAPFGSIGAWPRL